MAAVGGDERGLSQTSGLLFYMLPSEHLGREGFMFLEGFA